MGKTVSISIGKDEKRTLTEMLEFIARSCEKEGAQAAIVSFADCPYLDKGLERTMVERHFKYSAEYTYASGYPYGFAPEIIDAGAASILCEMSKTTALGRNRMTRTAIWDLIKTDINSFEVETVIAPRDYRLWRLEFCTGSKHGRMAAEALRPYMEERCIEPVEMGKSLDEVCQMAVKDIHVVRTVPGFYECGIRSEAGEDLPLEKFRDLAKQMKELSEKAVVSLSAEGDPLEHTDFVRFVEAAVSQGLDVLVETNGREVKDSTLQEVKDLADKYGVKVMWVVKSGCLGQTGPQTRSEASSVAGGSAINEEAVEALAKYFPGDVYPQIVRTNETEGQLEAFYRKWSAADSASCGKVLIQKYCSYCGTLPDKKPCDLSPLERNPCWHLRRDMVILHDGTVPVCFAREHSLDDKKNILGNAFDEGLSLLWDRMEKTARKDLAGERDELCRKCDEYYTFNF